MREYKGTVDGERVTVCLTEKQMWKLVNGRLNLHSDHWSTRDEWIRSTGYCPLCEQYYDDCSLCPLGRGHGDGFCLAIVDVISPLAREILGQDMFRLNKDGSIPKRTEAAFEKVRAVLLAGKRIARRPKEET